MASLLAGAPDPAAGPGLRIVTPLAGPHAVRLVLRFKALQFVNRTAAAFQAMGFWRKKTQGRGGTPRKGRTGAAAAVLFIMVAVWPGWFLLSAQILGSVVNRFSGEDREAGTAPPERPPDGAVGVSKTSRGPLARAPRADPLAVLDTSPETLARPAVRNGIAFVLCLVLLYLACTGLGFQSKDLARLDLEVEWLLALPIGVPWIFAAKVVEKTVLNFNGWMFLTPLCLCLALAAGLGPCALLAAPLLVLAANFAVAVLQFAVEVGARRLLRPAGLRNLQAAATLAGLVFFLLFLSLGMPIARGDYFLFGAMELLGGIAGALPPGQLVRALAGGGLWPGALLLAETAAMTAFAFGLIGWASRRGLEAVQGTFEGSRGAARGRGSAWRLSGVAGKDLRLLLRDKSRLITTAFLPVMMFVIQVVFNPDLLQGTIGSPLHWGAVSFGLGVYLLALFAPGVILDEREALWILFSVPRGISGVILRKAAMWAALAVLEAAALWAVGVACRGRWSGQDLFSLSWILLGLPLFASVAAAIGALGCDPLAEEPHHRFRQDLSLLVLLLGGILTGAIYLPDAWGRFVALLMFVALTVALWQKVNRSADWLLDPTAAPPRRIDLADGLMAVVLFFFLQAFATAAFLAGGSGFQEVLVPAYALAGSVAVLLTLFTLWREGVRVREAFAFVPDGRLFPALRSGARAGFLAAGIAAAYLAAVRGSGAFDLGGEPALHGGGGVLILLFVLAAPFFEEILFRGLVYRGLREGRNFKAAAVLSALLFAAVHPPVSVAPVFGLGLAAAWAYEKTRGLLAPIVAHAFYNAAVLGIGALLR